MNRKFKKYIKRGTIAAAVVVLPVYFIPKLTLFWFICGALDVSRNKERNWLMFQRYFSGNGMLTWLLSPINLFVDAISPVNPGVLKLDDLPPSHRNEVIQVLDGFKQNKSEIMADIDSVFNDSRRGMYIYRWFGKKQIENRPEFNDDYKYVKTIAVSVFSGGESTSWHYGPHRFSYRVLLNLTPIETDKVFIECQGEKHFWHEDPLYIFDDTLFHRSINELDARRYVVFLDVARPSYIPAFIEIGLNFIAYLGGKLKGAFYKNWKLIGTGAKSA